MAVLSLTNRLKDPRWWFGLPPKELEQPAPALSVTVIIPAYNKVAIISAVIESVLQQSYAAEQIVVIDDHSDDETAAIAEAVPGVIVLRTPENLGSKARAQNYALDYLESRDLETDVFVTLDGDTLLALDAIEHLLRAFNHPQTIIASGTIVSKDLDTVWQRGRHVQHVLNSALIRPSQSHNDALLVASGCLGAYHTERFKEVIGRFPEDTIVEDLETTMRTHTHGAYRVFFMSKAVCYTEDPRTLWSLIGQLERWYRGFMRSLINRKGNVFSVSKDVGFDICFFLFFLVLAPAMLPFAVYTVLTAGAPVWLYAILSLYVFGAILIAVIVGWKACQLRMFWQTVLSIPAVFLVQTVDISMYVRAFYMEVVRGKELRDWTLEPKRNT